MSGKGIWNPGFWNPEYSSDKESGIPRTIGIQNPSSTDKDWNPESTAWSPESKTVLDFLTWGEA